MATEKEIQYLKDNFDYKGFRDLGFYDKTIKPTDYDSQKERLCRYFGIKSIFEYELIGIQNKKFIKSDLNVFSEN